MVYDDGIFYMARPRLAYLGSYLLNLPQRSWGSTPGDLQRLYMMDATYYIDRYMCLLGRILLMGRDWWKGVT